MHYLSATATSPTKNRLPDMSSHSFVLFFGFSNLSKFGKQPKTIIVKTIHLCYNISMSIDHFFGSPEELMVSGADEQLQVSRWPRHITAASLAVVAAAVVVLGPQNPEMDDNTRPNHAPGISQSTGETDSAKTLEQLLVALPESDRKIAHETPHEAIVPVPEAAPSRPSEAIVHMPHIQRSATPIKAEAPEIAARVIERVPAAAPTYMRINTSTLEMTIAIKPTEGEMLDNGTRSVSAAKGDFNNAYFDNFRDWGLLGTDEQEDRSNLKRQLGIHMHTSSKSNAPFNALQDSRTGLKIGDAVELGNPHAVFGYTVTAVDTPTKDKLEGLPIYNQPVDGGVAILVLCKLDENGNRTNQNVVYYLQLQSARNK
jgi:hypothetical protein